MGITVDVRVWDLHKRTRKGRATRFEVRWKVADLERSKSFEFKAQADAFRAELLSAAKSGEPFDIASGLPAGQSKPTGPTCLAVALELVAAKWPEQAAKSRISLVDNLAYLLPHLVTSNARIHADARLALRASLGRPDATLTPTQVDAIRWLERASLPITAVDDAVVRKVLAATATKADGTALADSGRRQRRVYLSGLFTFAISRKYATANPVALVKIDEHKKTSKASVTPVTKAQIGDMSTARRNAPERGRGPARQGLPASG